MSGHVFSDRSDLCGNAVLTRETKRVAANAAKILLSIVGAVAAIMCLALAGISLYFSFLPSGTTIRAVNVVTLSAPLRFGASLEQDIPFADYITIAGSKLYASVLQGNISVLDVGTGRRTATIHGLGQMHGVAIDPEDWLGFASDSATNTVAVFDLRSNKLLHKIPVENDPDAIVYDRKFHMVYVAHFDGRAGDLIDPVKHEVAHRIPLGGAAEFAQVDPRTGLSYQNIHDKGEIVVIDPAKAAVAARFRLGANEQPTGLALDATGHRLFVTGFGGKMLAVNADTEAVISSLPIGRNSDGIAFDPGLKRICVANAFSATMTIIHQDTPDRYHVVENVNTHFIGHSVVVDPVTHRIYLAYLNNIAVYEVV